MKDNCVTCNKKSLHDKEEHIDFRIGYIQGAGQLCLDCYQKVYMKKSKKLTKGNKK